MPYEWERSGLIATRRDGLNCSSQFTWVIEAGAIEKDRLAKAWFVCRTLSLLASIGVLLGGAAMLGLVYQGYHIVARGVYVHGTGHWTPKVTLYPPVTISLHPTVLAGADGSCATEFEAEKVALRMGRQWIDHQLGW